MNEISNEALNLLVDEIYKRIEEKIYKNLNSANIEFCSEGIVKSVVGNSATVQLAFCETDAIPNLTGESLSVNDRVKIFYNKTNMAGAYIGVKF